MIQSYSNRSYFLFVILILTLLIHPIISDSTIKKSYYDLLEVSPSDTEKQIKKGYRRQALIHHPDKAKTEIEQKEKEILFVNLANAVEILTNSDLRVRYDYLLTQGIYEYDDKIYDWSTFNPLTKQFDSSEISFGDGRFSFRTTPTNFNEAKKRFEREKEEEEKETRALILALIASTVVALLPITYFYGQRWMSARADKKRKGEANVKLRDNQHLITQLNAERAADEERVKLENAERRREMREAREAAEEDVDDEEEEENDNENSTNPNAIPVDTDETKLPPAEVDSDDSTENSRRSGRANKEIFSCTLCRKKFKSSQQFDQHCQSNQHKKAEKASRG